jgi:stringent starvation protein B
MSLHALIFQSIYQYIIKDSSIPYLVINNDNKKIAFNLSKYSISDLLFDHLSIKFNCSINSIIKNFDIEYSSILSLYSYEYKYGLYRTDDNHISFYIKEKDKDNINFTSCNHLHIIK